VGNDIHWAGGRQIEGYRVAKVLQVGVGEHEGLQVVIEFVLNGVFLAVKK